MATIIPRARSVSKSEAKPDLDFKERTELNAVGDFGFRDSEFKSSFNSA